MRSSANERARRGGAGAGWPCAVLRGGSARRSDPSRQGFVSRTFFSPELYPGGRATKGAGAGRFFQRTEFDRSQTLKGSSTPGATKARGALKPLDRPSLLETRDVSVRPIEFREGPPINARGRPFRFRVRFYYDYATHARTSRSRSSPGRLGIGFAPVSIDPSPPSTPRRASPRTETPAPTAPRRPRPPPTPPPASVVRGFPGSVLGEAGRRVIERTAGRERRLLRAPPPLSRSRARSPRARSRVRTRARSSPPARPRTRPRRPGTRAPRRGSPPRL